MKAATGPPTGTVTDRADHWAAPVARRAVARLIDFALAVTSFVGLTFLLALAAGRPEDGTGVLILSIVGTFFAYLVYEVTLVAVWGRTLGKHLVGLEVIRFEDGGRPGLVRSFVRNLVPTIVLVGFFPLYPLTYVLAAIAKDNRWPNDRLAGTCVVLRRSS
ncbi:MAG: RDD family protein [Actinobacteria bacterium]|nr:RDD family protein [Actinomycetota bacterium]